MDLVISLLVLFTERHLFLTMFFPNSFNQALFVKIRLPSFAGNCYTDQTIFTRATNYIATSKVTSLIILCFFRLRKSVADLFPPPSILAANILLSQEGHVKLADFGVAGQLSMSQHKRNTFVGTPYWMAPEVIRQVGYDSKVNVDCFNIKSQTLVTLSKKGHHQADIWSLGITMIEMAEAAPPLSHVEPMKAMLLISQGKIPRLGNQFSHALRDFLSCCINHDVDQVPTSLFLCRFRRFQKTEVSYDFQRSTAGQLLQHKFVTSAGKTRLLTELIDRLEAWKATHQPASLRNSIAAR